MREKTYVWLKVGTKQFFHLIWFTKSDLKVAVCFFRKSFGFWEFFRLLRVEMFSLCGPFSLKNRSCKYLITDITWKQRLWIHWFQIPYHRIWIHSMDIKDAKMKSLVVFTLRTLFFTLNFCFSVDTIHTPRLSCFYLDNFFHNL